MQFNKVDSSSTTIPPTRPKKHPGLLSSSIQLVFVMDVFVMVELSA